MGKGANTRCQSKGTGAQRRETVREAGSENALPPPFQGAPVSVAREELVGDVIRQSAAAGIAFICAPEGFGKTSLLLQVADAVRADLTRGTVRLISGARKETADLICELKSLGQELSGAREPFLLVDEVPPLSGAEIKAFVAELRDLREGGVIAVVSCTPANRALVNALGDSHKAGSAALLVKPGEYARWAKAFSISGAIDGYGLTRGIPLLMPALAALSRGEGGEAPLDERTATLYRAVVEEADRSRGALSRLITLLLLIGDGSFADLERCGMRVHGGVLSRLQREYPVFLVGSEERTFSCLGKGSGPALRALRRDLAKSHPDMLLKAVRIEIKARRVDRAIALMEMAFDLEQALEVIGGSPAAFACAGRADFVRMVIGGISAERAASVDVGTVLALHLSSLLVGEYRMARSTCRELSRRAHEIEEQVPAADWGIALAFRKVWGSCARIDLPQLGEDYLRQAHGKVEQQLLEHVRTYRGFLEGLGGRSLEAPIVATGSSGGQTGSVDVPQLLREIDAVLIGALSQDPPDGRIENRSLEHMVSMLTERRLIPLATRVRAAASLKRLLAGLPVVDERAFSDMVTVAVRESDVSTQLLYMIAEGWQCAVLGQLVNARFRGQQVLKFAEPHQGFLRGWASLLEQVATLLNSSRVMIREEADVLDLSRTTDDPAEAWSIALMLSAADYDSDLSVWYSVHREVLLEAGFRPLARLALSVMGKRADPMRRLLPSAIAAQYLFAHERAEGGGLPASPARLTVVEGLADLGQVSIRLLGGFQVSKNGHHLTERLWGRKRSGVLAARLTLALGAFVGRHVLADELWPSTEQRRALQNLYTATSALRSAFGQAKGGPQYILSQGDGIGLNTEYIASDVAEFDLLVRSILLQRAGTSPQVVIDACLKLEKLYLGPLYTPGFGEIAFFTRMRRVYESKYIDCLIQGIDAAMGEGDTAVASWLADAALGQCPGREDVLRRSMQVLDKTGRRREVVDLYSSHLYYLREDRAGEPEQETQRLYEEIINTSGLKAFV